MRRPQFRVIESTLQLLIAELILKDINLLISAKRRKRVIADGENLVARLSAWREEKKARRP